MFNPRLSTSPYPNLFYMNPKIQKPKFKNTTQKTLNFSFKLPPKIYSKNSKNSKNIQNYKRKGNFYRNTNYRIDQKNNLINKSYEIQPEYFESINQKRNVSTSAQISPKGTKVINSFSKPSNIVFETPEKPKQLNFSFKRKSSNFELYNSPNPESSYFSGSQDKRPRELRGSESGNDNNLAIRQSRSSLVNISNSGEKYTKEYFSSHKRNQSIGSRQYIMIQDHSPSIQNRQRLYSGEIRYKTSNNQKSIKNFKNNNFSKNNKF